MNAQVSFTGSYSQNFDGMGTGTVAPAGWSVHGTLGGDKDTWIASTGIPSTGTISAATAGTVNAALIANSNAAALSGSGSNTQGYNFALSGSTTDRALGSSPTSGAGIILQLRLTNNTGEAVDRLRLSYDIRRFRAVTTDEEFPGYRLFVSVDGGVTWSGVSDFNTALSGGPVNVPSSAGVTSAGPGIVALPAAVADGSEIRFRWVDDNGPPSPDQTLGLDNVVVATAQPAPTVTLIAPSEAASFNLPATINLAATAADSNGSIAKVEFYAGATKLAEDTEAPYEFAWSGMISGSYVLTARAFDNEDGVTTSSPVGITVSNPNNQPPSVTLTSPLDGSNIAGDSTVLTASASDADGVVAKVEFYNGGTKLGEDTTAPFTYNWSGVATGIYSVSARAIDNDGAFVDSAAASVTFVVPVQTTAITRRPAGQPGSVWKYLDNGSDQGTAWRESAFDDSGWASGAAPLGYGDSHIQTTVNSGPSGNRIITTYLRRTFNVTGAGAVQSLNLNVLRDDGVVVYINGVEVARQNMPEGPINYLTNAASIVDSGNETTYFTSTVTTLPPLNEGSNVIAVELHNRDGNSSDLGFDLELVTASLPGTPPTIELTGPADGAEYTAPATVAITADASDSDGVVEKVEFFNGNEKLGEDLSAPFTFDWSVVPQGDYILTARATDNYGLTALSDPVEITVGPPNTIFPTVTITSPLEEDAFLDPATILITAAAADADGSVVKVEFFEGANKLGEDTVAPFTFEWAGVTAGTYTLTARATDNLTAATVSAPVVVTVAPNLPPSITLATPLDTAAGLGSGGRVNLTATVSDPESQALAVTFYGRLKSPPPGEEFTLVTIPDTQFYSENTGGNRFQLFTNQTNWIVASRDLLKTRFVAHMGDMTQNYNNTEAEFVRADQAMAIIENPLTTLLTHGIPWGGAPGNHDIGSGNNTSLWNQYFGVSRWVGRPYFGGGYTSSSSDQNWQTFSAGGMDFLVVNLAYNSNTSGTAAVLNWADALLKAHPNHRAIVTSHWLIGTSFPPAQSSWGGHGQAVYDNLKDNPNLFLLLCGHIHGEGRRADVFEGRTVNTVLQDYQSRANGGDSWLRYFTFKPSENKIYAFTYKANTAPVGNPLGGTFETDADSQFTLDYDMASTADWTALGTVSLAAGETSATLPWIGLDADTDYEWYAAVSDGVTPVGSSPRTFTANGNAAPSITLTTPVEGSMVTRPDTLNFAATANDLDGEIARVEFYNGSTKVGEDLTAPYTFAWDAPAGTHTVSARAIDGEGLHTDSATATATVKFALEPAITGTSGGGSVSGGGDFVPGSTVTFTATPNPDHSFAGWIVDGAPAGVDPVLQIAVTESTTIQARFVSVLLITEIQSNQASSGKNDFWELTNTGDQTIDLSGWKWDDDSRNPNDAAAVTIPTGTMIAPGESIVFTPLPAAAFRTWWGISETVQVITGGPGFGMNDAVSLFKANGTEVLFLSYAARNPATGMGFTRSDGSASAGGHAGVSAGGLLNSAMIWDPVHGTTSPRYKAAEAGQTGAFSSTENVLDVGSPGYSGWVAPIKLLITEIQSNQASSGKNDFWELTNIGLQSVDLSGWKWDDDSRNPNDAAAVTIPAGTAIAPGESIVFTPLAAATFRTWWGIPGTVQVVTGGPGFGMNDAVALFNAGGTEVLFLSYAARNEATGLGFTRSDGSASAGGHAGVSAGGLLNSAMIWDPVHGTVAPRYKAAVAGQIGAFSSTENALDVGSPGYSGFTAGSGPAIELTLSANPTTFSESAANPASVGTVTRSGATAGALEVTLSSSDATEATVPVMVTIQDGQASANFDITAVDDTFPDDNRVVTLTASATGATPGILELTVQDDGDTLDTDFLLTEIQSNQSTGRPTGANDYWELTNVGAAARDISGFSWHDSGRSAAAAQSWKLPNGTMIEAGESVIFTATDPTVFRAWWNLAPTVQVFQSAGAPGLGQDDGISFFDPQQNELFFFSYAAGGFTKENGDASTGTHAGRSGGGSADSQALIWVPSSGAANPRYTAATGSNYGSFSAVSPATDLGSPGLGNVRTVSLSNNSVLEGDSGTTILSLAVTRSDTATAFSVDYAVTGGTATAGIDYVAPASGTLTFVEGGAATQNINITINGDTVSEPDETIVVTLSNLANTSGSTLIGTAVGIGTILNDDVISPTLTLQIGGSTVGSGSVTTLRVAPSGFPAPELQWYRGEKGDISNPVNGATGATLVTPVLTATESFWVRASNDGGDFDSDTIVVSVIPAATSIDLSNYVRVGRYDLPEPMRTALPAGTPAYNLLCQEASGVAYNWDTDTLFIIGDGGKSVTQVSKTGVLIDTMTLALRAGAPQGTDFYDPEGITYIGNGQFVFSEERDRQLVKFTYAAGATISRADVQTVKIGTFVDNTGTEGLSWDPQTGGFICLKETSPIGIFQTTIDFVAGTASNGSPTTVNSINLFDPALLGMSDVADVFALSNLPAFVGQPQAGNLLVIGQENARVVNVDRTGVISSTLQIVSDAGNPLSAGDQQHEGVTVDRAGNLYIVSENGGGSIDYPQLWVYAPSAVPNAAPTGVTLDNSITSIIENTSTASRVKIGDIIVTDDGLGLNSLSLSGADAAFFEIDVATLYLKSGTTLDYETKTSYSITINVDDITVGTTPDLTLEFTLTVIDQEFETAPAPALIITEVAPWSSGNSPGVAADWFEVTNVSENTVNVTGWKVDDDSNSFALARDLSGITSIAPGESVIFVETNDLAGKTAAFINTWFGGIAPAGLQIGNYTGAGIGLGTGGDAVNLFNASGALHSRVSFGASPATAPYTTFDNTLAQNNVPLTTFSAVGVNGAFIAANSANEIGSPGYSAPGVLRVTEVAPWSSGNSPVAADWFEVTNSGARAVDISGWKVDDSSESPAAALPLIGITSIAPGESVIFIETANLTTTRASFLGNWFGASPPAGLQVGSYSGSGIGLSTGGDAVNLYDTNNVRRVNVSFGVSPSAAPFTTFDNAAGINVGALTQFSSAGINGAFVAANSSIEVGSPGTIATPAATIEVNPVISGGKGGSVTGGGAFAVGGTATLTAIPDAGYNFRGWRVNGSSTPGSSTTLEVSVAEGITVEAVFSYSMQVLHLADGEAGLLASQTAPNLAALVDAFDSTYANTLILSGGDNFLPGPFLSAGTDPSLSAIPSVGLTNFARPDIAIHNLIGVEASAIGNHEWDLGSNVFMDAIRPDGAWIGAQFPHISSNLDYSADSAANGRYTNVPLDGVATAVPEASTLKSRLVPTAIITKGGEKIGLVGVTTQILRSISSPSGTIAKGFPAGTTGVDDMDLLATHVQPFINELVAEGVNKIILLSHLQQISNEQLLATKLSGVDIILAAGSNTRLGDTDDVAVAFPGHAANFAGTYPLVTAGNDGKPTLIVNTDNEYTYLGRLVVDFDASGEIILADLPDRVPVNGAYAATEANVATAWGTTVGNLATTAFAAGTRGAAVKQVVEAVQAVITAKDGDVKGYTSVYLEGERNFVRSEETNFGNLSSDANAEFARAILNDGVPVVSLKNGGGIRAQIGAIAVGSGEKLPPVANPAVGKLAGGISQLDIENALRFNNRLMVFDTTPQGLKNILEHGVAAGVLQGRFPQIGGVSFAWDPARPAGSRVTTISLIGEAGQLQYALYDGAFSPWAPPVIRLVTLNFLASNAASEDGLGTGGDGYPMRANGTNFRFLLADGSLSAPVDPTLNFTAVGVVPANPLGEQQAFSDFLALRHATPATAFSVSETPASLDLRIQNLSLRTEAVPFDLTLTLGGGGVGSIGNETLAAGQRQGVRFTLGERRLVSLSGTGAPGLTAELLDLEGNVVASFDDEGELLIGALLDAGSYLLRVLNPGDAAATLSLTVDTSTIPATRPDVAVGSSFADLRGVDRYSAPASQAIILKSRKLKPVRAIAVVANRGTLPDTLKVRGTAGNSLFRTVYLSGGANVTASLVSGAFETGEISGGDGSVVITASISPDRKRLVKKRGKRTVTLRRAYVSQIDAISTTDPTVRDGGQIRVQTK